MATQPADNPGQTPPEVPAQPNEPETTPTSPDFDQPDTGPVELPPPD